MGWNQPRTEEEESSDLSLSQYVCVSLSVSQAVVWIRPPSMCKPATKHAGILISETQLPELWETHLRYLFVCLFWPSLTHPSPLGHQRAPGEVPVLYSNFPLASHFNTFTVDTSLLFKPLCLWYFAMAIELTKSNSHSECSQHEVNRAIDLKFWRKILLRLSLVRMFLMTWGHLICTITLKINPPRFYLKMLLNIDDGYGWTALWMQLMPLNHTVKRAKMVRLMLYIFCHNKKNSINDEF